MSNPKETKTKQSSRKGVLVFVSLVVILIVFGLLVSSGAFNTDKTEKFRKFTDEEKRAAAEKWIKENNRVYRYHQPTKKSKGASDVPAQIQNDLKTVENLIVEEVKKATSIQIKMWIVFDDEKNAYEFYADLKSFANRPASELVTKENFEVLIFSIGLATTDIVEKLHWKGTWIYFTVSGTVAGKITVKDCTIVWQKIRAGDNDGAYRYFHNSLIAEKL